MVTIAHHVPTQTPCQKDGGNWTGFLRRSYNKTNAKDDQFNSFLNKITIKKGLKKLIINHQKNNFEGLECHQTLLKQFIFDWYKQSTGHEIPYQTGV